MSKTPTDETGVEAMLPDVNHLPRANQWETDSNLRAIGFETVDFFKNILIPKQPNLRGLKLITAIRKHRNTPAGSIL